MLYAFARDGACPGSKLWHTISPRLGIPVNAVCAMACAAVLIALPAVYSTTAYAAVTSITTIGLYISYIIPMICRLTVGKNDFVRARAPGVRVASHAAARLTRHACAGSGALLSG